MIGDVLSKIGADGPDAKVREICWRIYLTVKADPQIVQLIAQKVGCQ